MKGKSNKKLLCILLLFVMVFTIVSCNKNDSNNESVQIDTSNQLQIFRTDLKLTQDQVASQIKAEYLVKNNGYLEDDEVTIIVNLQSKPIIDLYNDSTNDSFLSVSDYMESKKATSQLETIKNEQTKLIETLNENQINYELNYCYNTIMNAVSITTAYKNLNIISSFDNVLDTYLSDTYNLPQATSGSTTGNAIENIVEVYSTGIFDSSSVDYNGNGTAVAVLDSGFDMSHTVFQTQPDYVALTKTAITNLLSQTNAASTTSGLTINDVYYSEKIPYYYDYADKDPDVFPYDSEHGTHVAGIIGGKDDVITGVAVKTQLVLMKVFPDLDAGGKTDDILAALEDAVLLGVDAINMSLGSSCGFAREKDGSAINAVYDKIYESGISLITAASNSYSSAYGSAQGNTNLVTNPDSGTVGSPSTYAACLSVASISGVKSRYIVGNDGQIIFFKESNSISGDENDFFKELGITEGMSKEYEYVTIPGVGLSVNFDGLDLSGKIALIKRGDNTFEEKAMNAKNAGAVACIIYNNIDGDIIMSMGKTDHIPTVSISKDDGSVLAKYDTGKLVISYENQAGPFISDYSSWGPSPNLEMKPEITAHGGEIYSAVPGGGYDSLSGTSMATPNLCGIVILIRQYLKEHYTNLTSKEICKMCNQLLMSTATITLNEEGNPYSPRKQGAGLASLYKSVNTKAYITVDGIDRSKLELYDDPDRTGVYEMNFNIKNISDQTLNYTLDLVGMTESVSTSDKEHVSETPQLLNGNYEIEVISGGSLNGNDITIDAYAIAKVKVTYKLSNEDKETIESLFPYGMYVEGFVKLLSNDEGIDLNVPFLAFYGDWTEAPMFDKTYYEVQSQAYDQSIDDEDKIKADYYATTPYGSYYYNYMIPLGTYLYDIDKNKYDAIPASTDHIAVSNILGTIDGFSSIYAGLLRCAKTMNYSIVDKLTGEVIWSLVDDNCTKAYAYNGSPIPYYNYLKLKSTTLNLVNNREYTFSMSGLLDYGDGGATTNVRNSFSFDFVLDDEAPTLKEVTYRKEYDKTLKKDRYYITMTIYDNQYVQSVTPIIFTSSSSYTFLTENPIPVYSEKGQNNVIEFEITDYLEELYTDEMITSALGFSIDDYALNSNLYLCQLPGTRGDFKFTKDGTMDGTDLFILSAYEGEIVDITEYLATSDTTVDEDKDYLNHLIWTSSNEKIVQVKEGQIRCMAPGKATITVAEAMDGKQAVLIINVKEKELDGNHAKVTRRKSNTTKVDDESTSTLKTIRFSYFDTLFAYSRSAQSSEIGQTGDRKYLSAISSLSFYPGEKIQLFPDLDPWYAADKYELNYASTNPTVAVVDEDGIVTALKKGSTTITLSVEGSNLMAKLRITINSEFVIENRTLVAYKGLGGDVVIPDDEGILYIGAYAFCLYDTDTSIELSEEDWDANKIPNTNTSITSVVIPHGVIEVQKYAFYNCKSLKSVTLPTDKCKIIREFAFYNDEDLQTINFDCVETIGAYAFYGCKNLSDVVLPKVYSLGQSAFEGCKKIQYMDLSKLRNAGAQVFKNCTGLEAVTLTKDTKLSFGMFVGSGLKSVDIYETNYIPSWCFAKCSQLESVVLHNSLHYVGKGAFSDCGKLTSFECQDVEEFYEQAFYNDSSLESFTLPNCETILGNYCFYKCTNLKKLIFGNKTNIVDIQGSLFEDTILTTFEVSSNNKNYAVSADGKLLLSADKYTIILAARNIDENYTIPLNYNKIGKGAFAGTAIKSVTITNPFTIIDEYSFANCKKLTIVTLPNSEEVVINAHAFHYDESLTTVYNLNKVKKVGDYAFAQTGPMLVELGENATYGEGAFFASNILAVSIGKNTKFGLGAFQYCSYLQAVIMPELGGVHFGIACFAYDVSLATIDLSKHDSVLEDQVFYGCVSLKSANLLKVKEIGDYAFCDCSALNYVNMPIVEIIGDGAFSRYDEDGGAPIFNEIELPDTLEYIGDGAFIGCEGLQEINIPSSVSYIGDYTFAYCLLIEKVTLPSSIKRIGKYMFAGCESLSNINLNNIRVIDAYAFTSCVSLQNVDLSKVEGIGFGAFASTYLCGDINAPRLKIIGDYAFQSTYFSNLYAPILEYIGSGAFWGNTELEQFSFSENLNTIKEAAFEGCSSLKNFYFNGEETAVINDYALLDNGNLYTIYSNGHYELNSVPGGKDIKTLEVIENTYRIATYAGSENPNVEYIILPDTLKIIGNYAFYGYKNLKTVKFKSINAPALEDSYNYKLALEEDDPGYNLLHNQFDLFGLELYYCQFIDLVGKNKPIKMVLPANEKINGYDSVVFEAYFGKVENAERSEYIARENSLVEFIGYFEELQKIDNITINNEELIDKAITAFNSIKQDVTMFGYTTEEWSAINQELLAARKEIYNIKISHASKALQQLQMDMDNVSPIFDVKNLSMYQSIAERLSVLTAEEKAYLDYTNYNNLVLSHSTYNSTLKTEIQTANDSASSILGLAVLLGLGSLSSFSMVYLLFKRW